MVPGSVLRLEVLLVGWFVLCHSQELAVTQLDQATTEQPQPAAADYCTGLQENLCDERSYPVGTTAKKCGSKVCGFTIKTVKRSPCSEEQRALLARLLPMCSCSADMADALARVPSLVQTGQVDADRFARVDAEILNDIVQASQCLETAGYLPTDVNQVNLLSSLDNNLRSVKALAGINAFTVIQLEDLRVADYQAAMDKLQACMDGGVAVDNPDSLTAVPSYCQDFVTWYDNRAANATQLLLPMINEVQRQLLNYLTDVAVSLDAVIADVQKMVNPDSWHSVFAAARGQAMLLECDDPTTCYEGLLAGPWQRLQDTTDAVTGTHPALDVAAQAAATIQDLLQQAQAIFCDVARKLTDTAYRQLAIYKGMWNAILAADYPASEQLYEHPRILSDILVQMSGLALIPEIAAPMTTARDAVKDVQDQVAAAAREFVTLYTALLKQMAADNYSILNILKANTPTRCTDGRLPSCPINFCDAAVSPVAPPECPRGSGCITDPCNNCQATCVSLSSNAIAVMAAWMDVIRASDLSKIGDTVKAGSATVADSLNYLVTEASSTSSPGGRNYLYRSGLLTYNEVGKASGSFPCFQGLARMCYSMKGFKKQCVLVPRVGACLVKKTWAMPNEHVPWVAMHSGIIAMLSAAGDRLHSSTRSVVSASCT